MKKVVSLFVVCAMLLSLCTSMTFVANAADKTIDDFAVSILNNSFDSEETAWSRTGAVYDADKKAMGIELGASIGINWDDGAIHQGLISYQFDIMFNSDVTGASGSSTFGFRDSAWKDNGVQLFLSTSGAMIRRGFGGDNIAWSNAYSATKDTWHTFKVVMDTNSGEYSLYCTPQGSDFDETPVLTSNGRYSQSNPAAAGLRGITLQGLPKANADASGIGYYIDNVKVSKATYAYEAINNASSADEVANILEIYAENKLISVSKRDLALVNKSALCADLKANTLTSDADIVNIIGSAFKSFINNDFENETGDFIITGSENSDTANTGKYKDASATTNTTFDVSQYKVIPKDTVVEFRAKPVGSTWFPFTLATGGKNVNVNWNIDASMVASAANWTYYRLVLDAYDAQTIGDVELAIYYSFDGITWYERATSALGQKFNATMASTPVVNAPITSLSFNICYVDDLKFYQSGKAPQAKDAKVVIGESAEASYTFCDAEGDVDAGASYVWQVSSNNADFTDISGATEKTLALTSAYEGKYIRCQITPKSASYPTDGETVVTEGVKYAPYTVVRADDFENTASVENKMTVVDGAATGDSNATKYAEVISNYDYLNLNTTADELVVEFRSKISEGKNNTSVQLIFKAWGGLIVEQNFTNNTDWKYYRFVIDTDEATTLDEAKEGVKMYESVDGKEWKLSTAARMSDRAETSTDATRFSYATQFRLYGGCFDDVKIYKYGTAPVGTNAKLEMANGMLTASYDYSDAEGDPMGTTSCVWEVSDDNVVFTPVEGVTSASWTPNGLYNNKYIRAIVTPKSASYPTDGEAIVTNSVQYHPQYVELFSNDYEDADTTTEPLLVNGAEEGDSVNTSNYIKSSRIYTFKTPGYLPDSLVMEFRGKTIPYENNGRLLEYIQVYFIAKNWGGMEAAVTFDAASKGYNTDWTYYRVVVNAMDATTNSEVDIKYFISADGINWIEGDVAHKASATVSETGSYKELIDMIRFDYAMVDDVKIYQYGTAPKAESASINVTDDGMYAVVNGYSDAEGDAQATPKCQWQYSYDNEVFTDITGQTGVKYADNGRYDGAYLRCAVYPTSSKWPCYGEVLYTDSIQFESTKDAFVTYGHFDNDGNAATSYVPAEGFKTKVYASNNTDEPLSVTAVSAVYNIETHELIKVNYESATLGKNEKNKEFTLTSVALTEDEIPEEGTFVKIMILDSFEGMKPYGSVGYVLETEE